MNVPTWIDIVGPALIDKVAAQLQQDPAFLEDLRKDANGALKAHMGIDFPILLHVYGEGDEAYIADVPETARLGGVGEELSDADLDRISSGCPTNVKSGATQNS